MLKGLVIACLLIVEPPSQTNKKPANGSGALQTPQSDQRGTQSNPLIVDVHTKQNYEEAAREAEKGTWEKHVNLWNIGLTCAIALYAHAQVFVYLRQTHLLNQTLAEVHTQAGHMKEQVDLMREQAKVMLVQTKEIIQQRRNMISRERARISILFPDESEAMTIRTDNKISLGSVRLNLENLGVTPAVEIVAEYDTFACNAGDAPPSPHLFWTASPANINGVTWAPIGPLTIDPKFNGEKLATPFYVFLRLRIGYRDVFQKRRRFANFLMRREFLPKGADGAISDEFWIAVGNEEDNQETYGDRPPRTG
jgi:hypothetical protein